MRFQILSLLAFAAAVSAATTETLEVTATPSSDAVQQTFTALSTVTLFLPGFDTQSIYASVVGSSKDAMTTYALNCPPGIDADECGLGSGITIAEGPSSMEMTMSYGDEYVSEGCKIYGTTKAACSAEQSFSGLSSTYSTTVDISDIPYGGFMPVIVTATPAAEASSTSDDASPASTATSTGASNTATTMSTATSTSTSSNTASKSASTSSTTASGNLAFPQVTGNAHWAVGGAAMALALAAV